MTIANKKVRSIMEKQKLRKPEYFFVKEYPKSELVSQEKYDRFHRAMFPYFQKGFESRNDEVAELRAQIHEKNTTLDRLQDASNDLLKQKIDLDKIGTDIEQVTNLKVKFIQAVGLLRGIVEENTELRAELLRMEENRRGRAKNSKAVKKTVKVKK